jgi:hypothetical protein
MKSQPKSPFAQLNLPLLDPVALPLPAAKDRQLMQTLTELLLIAASAPTQAEGKTHEPQVAAERLDRGAIVYIRQSTPSQVLHHREGRRQHARRIGLSRARRIRATGGAVCAGSVNDLLPGNLSPGAQWPRMASPARIVRHDGNGDCGPGMASTIPPS